MASFPFITAILKGQGDSNQPLPRGPTLQSFHEVSEKRPGPNANNTLSEQLTYRGLSTSHLLLLNRSCCRTLIKYSASGFLRCHLQAGYLPQVTAAVEGPRRLPVRR